MSQMRRLIIPEQIKTRSDPKRGSYNERVALFANRLNAKTVDSLKDYYYYFTGSKPMSIRKIDIIAEFTHVLVFSSEANFSTWFNTFSPLSQRVIWAVVFYNFVDITSLQKELNQEFTQTIQDRRVKHISIKEEFDFSRFLRLHAYYNNIQLTIIPLFRDALIPWLEPPPAGILENCVFEPSPECPPWNNSLAAYDSFPLFCEVLKGLIEQTKKTDLEINKVVKGGFSKKDLKELYASSGLQSFPFNDEWTPNSADLLARFLLCIKDKHIFRPEDGHKEIRKIVKTFFAEVSPSQSRYSFPDRAYLEYSIFIDHFSRGAGNVVTEVQTMPPSRRLFMDLLYEIAKDAKHFDADKLSDYLLFKGSDFSFSVVDRLESTLRLKADDLMIPGLSIEKGHDDIYPQGVFYHELFERPLFKAYCYLFAVLGLLEITQKEPLLCREKSKKLLPISYFDSLASIKITEFGLWCLDLSKKQPARPETKYEAIADKELLLVTIQGNSLERQVFLDKIGEKLGENRWRISLASFIADITSKEQIADRIARFRRLIDRQPAPQWEDLFAKVSTRAGSFDTNQLAATVYTLPEDKVLRQELLEDPDLKSVALRAEGCNIIVLNKDHRKFFELLSRHGITHFVHDA